MNHKKGTTMEPVGRAPKRRTTSSALQRDQTTKHHLGLPRLVSPSRSQLLQRYGHSGKVSVDGLKNAMATVVMGLSSGRSRTRTRSRSRSRSRSGN